MKAPFELCGPDDGWKEGPSICSGLTPLVVFFSCTFLYCVVLGIIRMFAEQYCVQNYSTKKNKIIQESPTVSLVLAGICTHCSVLQSHIIIISSSSSSNNNNNNNSCVLPLQTTMTQSVFSRSCNFLVIVQFLQLLRHQATRERHRRRQSFSVKSKSVICMWLSQIILQCVSKKHPRHF